MYLFKYYFLYYILYITLFLLFFSQRERYSQAMEKYRAPSAKSHADSLPPRGVQVCLWCVIVFTAAPVHELSPGLHVISIIVCVCLCLLWSACNGRSSRWTRRRPQPPEVHTHTFVCTIRQDGRTLTGHLLELSSIANIWWINPFQIFSRTECQDFYLYLPSHHTLANGLPFRVMPHSDFIRY